MIDLDKEGVAGTFPELTDTPADYTGHGDKLVKVKATEDGLEFTAPGGATDEKVGVSSNDTTPGYLIQKIIGTANKVTMAEVGDGGDEDLQLNVGSDILDKAVAGQVAGLTGKTTPAGADVFLLEDSAASNAKKKITLADLLACVRKTIILQSDNFDNPNNTDWTVNSLATPEADEDNNALSIRAFSGISEEGVGFQFTIPSTCSNLKFKFKHRAKTAPGGAVAVKPKLYHRGIPDNGAVASWAAAGQAFTKLDITTNEYYQYDEETIAIADLGLVAGRHYQFELTRTPADAEDNLSGDWYLLETEIVFL